MQLGRYEIRFEKRPTVGAWQAGLISSAAVVFALVLLGALFLLDRVNPIEAYHQIYSYAFANPRGFMLTINRAAFLLLCTIAFIIPYRAGLWNIGMTGQVYVGALAGFAVVLAFNGHFAPSDALSPGLILPLMILGSMTAAALYGGLAGFLRGKWGVNEIVITMILNFIAFWIVAWMIRDGGLLMNPLGRAESFSLPTSLRAPMIMGVPFTVYIAVGLALAVHFWLERTPMGFQIGIFGRNPAAARYAGIHPLKISLLVFLVGGAIAGLAGYHLFGAVPGVYKIARNYNIFGDLAFYGLICGLIALARPLAAIPVALLLGGLSIGGRFAQGLLQLRFGVDYALLGMVTITLVAFQFFYHYRIVWTRREDGFSDGVSAQKPGSIDHFRPGGPG